MLRKTFIIKPRLQIKYLIIAMIVVCLTGIAVYYTFWSSLIRAPGLDQLSSGEWKALEHGYQTSFVWVVFIVAVAIGLESIFFFHRLIGPIFVFERFLRLLGNGDFSRTIRLRRKDELKDMSVEFQVLINNVQRAVAEDRARIEQIRAQLDQGNIPGAKENLSALTRWFKID